MKFITSRIILISLSVILLLVIWLLKYIPTVENKFSLEDKVNTYTVAPVPTFILDSREYIAFSSKRDGNGEIYLMKVDGIEQINLTNHPADERDPTWSPDGQYIAFASDRDGSEDGDADIYIMSIRGTSVRRLTNTPGFDSSFSPAWSPDGKRIAYSKENGTMWVINIDGTNNTNIRDYHHPFSFNPTWSPDGRHIVFTSYYFNESRRYEPKGNYGGDYEIYKINSDGTFPIRLTYDDNCWDSEPAWSLDGKYIAFAACGYEGKGQISVMEVDGKNLTRLTPPPHADKKSSENSPTWSPDGKRIAFSSNYDDNDEIYVINADGTNLIRLTNNPSYDGSPAWSPYIKKE